MLKNYQLAIFSNKNQKVRDIANIYLNGSRKGPSISTIVLQSLCARVDRLAA